MFNHIKKYQVTIFFRQEVRATKTTDDTAWIRGVSNSSTLIDRAVVEFKALVKFPEPSF